jgi:hypothetical protein
MSVAENYPPPLARVLPWWPGALLAAMITGALVAAVQFDWLAQAGLPPSVRDALTPLTDWKMAVAIGLVLTLFFGAVIDAFSLRSWRKGIVSFELNTPNRETTWTYCAYKETVDSVSGRRDLDTVNEAIRRRHDKLISRLRQGWLFKYYVLCFALPLAGLLLGWYNLEALGGALPASELFRPLVLLTLGSLVVMVLAVLVARQGVHAVDTWEERARQIGVEEHRRRSQDAAPEVSFRLKQVEVDERTYFHTPELVLSQPAAQDVEVILQARDNDHLLELPPGGKVVIPAGQRSVAPNLRIQGHSNHPHSGTAPQVELRITSAQNARLGATILQTIRWRLEQGEQYTDDRPYAEDRHHAEDRKEPRQETRNDLQSDANRDYETLSGGFNPEEFYPQ